MIDAFTKKKITKILDEYIEAKIPKHVRNELRLNFTIRGSNVTLFQERPAYMSDDWVKLNIAQFRIDQKEWKVYWQDSKSKWHHIDDIAPSSNFETQLKVVDQGHKGLFDY